MTKPKQKRNPKQKSSSDKLPFLLELGRRLWGQLAPHDTRSHEPDDFNPYHKAPEDFSLEDIKRLIDKFHKKGLTIKNLQEKLIKAREKNRKFHEQVKELKARIAELEAMPLSASDKTKTTDEGSTGPGD